MTEDLKMKNDINVQYLTQCHSANLPAIKVALNNGAEVNYENGACLIRIISGHGLTKEKKLSLEYLLDHGAELHNPTETLLTWAVKAKDLELVKFFLKKGIKPNDDDGTAIFTAMQNKDQNIMSYLFAYEAVVDDSVKEYFEIAQLPVPQCVETFSHIQQFALEFATSPSEAQQRVISYAHNHFPNCDMLPHYLASDFHLE